MLVSQRLVRMTPAVNIHCFMERIQSLLSNLLTRPISMQETEVECAMKRPDMFGVNHLSRCSYEVITTESCPQAYSGDTDGCRCLYWRDGIFVAVNGDGEIFLCDTLNK
eukprot:GHVH01004593.1.p1 GENE.GHVH01004593.1~~GHVH01004593.1.p1  ORF type:complete len:109 (+),score=9.62 GHVH01004593.1:145-471(+)